MQQSNLSALFGAMSNEHRLNLIANNLANVNTTGYKKDKVAFKDVFMHFAHDYILDSKPYIRAKPLWPEADVIAKPRLSDQKTDFSQGSLKVTGNPLDLAIQGEGFFKVQNPQTGDTFYTRNGNYMLDNGGQIIDGNGNYLLAGGGPVTVPQNSTLVIDQAGNIRAGEQEVGAIDLVTFNNPEDLKKVGANLYTMDNPAEIPLNTGAPEVPEGEDSPRVVGAIQQGFLESSNVEVVTEMVAMIEVQRSFEAYQKIMTGTQQMDQKLIATAAKA
ncbi:MAG: flagellar basal-body rod protein FlgF [Desulfovibrio sp.]|uniref:flagellar basal-body rod protein FlgF n=1 Tax=Desulfovibrio sp. 7SRBS1 TaxID=3378064 RepID=UPI003B4185D0